MRTHAGGVYAGQRECADNAVDDGLRTRHVDVGGERKGPRDVPLRDWRKAGLTTQCRVRLKLFTLDQPIVERQLGALSKRDRDAVRVSLARACTSA